MQRRRISRLIQMESIGMPDTTSMNPPCHSDEMEKRQVGFVGK
jgi:hypothetical protein